jgi:Transposase DDE domain group 1
VKRRLALLRSNRPRDSPAGVHPPAPTFVRRFQRRAHRIDRPLDAFWNPAHRASRVVVSRKRHANHPHETARSHFFYITNLRDRPASAIVFGANDRCNQENLLKELLSGVEALRAPVDTLVANWAYMVMASLAWTLKAWFALSVPARGRWSAKHEHQKQRVLRMGFQTFLNSLMRAPCQIVRTGRRIVYRLLSWSPWQDVLLRVADALRRPMRC